MYLRICLKTKFRQLHFRGRSTLHKIGEFYLSDYGRQTEFGQNAILASSKAKIRNWKIINCFLYIYVPNPFHWQKVRDNYFWSRSRVDRFYWDCHLIMIITKEKHCHFVIWLERSDIFVHFVSLSPYQWKWNAYHFQLLLTIRQLTWNSNGPFQPSKKMVFQRQVEENVDTARN